MGLIHKATDPEAGPAWTQREGLTGIHSSVTLGAKGV